MLPIEGGGVNFLREAYRVLAPGGLLRIVTPDLAKYACGLVSASEGFLQEHGKRFRPMESLAAEGGPPSRAGVVNNIFRNYGHQWIYDFAEVRLAARKGGVDPSRLCRSDRAGRGMPRWANGAIRRANQPRNRTLTCWLDQPVREPESMYVVVSKPLGKFIGRSGF